MIFKKTIMVFLKNIYYITNVMLELYKSFCGKGSMENTGDNVRQRLIEVGRSEFLEKGYIKASMRNISSSAQVTTGAIYFFFQSKERFFREILEETAMEWKKYLQQYSESEINGSKTSAENDRELITFLYAHKEEVRILFEKSEGTLFEGYREELCEILESAFLEFYKRFGGKKEDKEIVRIVVRMRLQGYFELLHEDYTMEQAIRYAELLAYYGDSGFAGMMKQYKNMLEGSVG